jgi:tRNA-uridine 2-sulfurtransferase
MKRLADGPKRVVVAMSGGVDSSTVAGLLVEAGHEVIGVMMKLYDQGKGDPDASKQCCGLDDVADARRVADELGIPFYVGNYQDVFREDVVSRFIGDYAAGRTPNPCVRCNDTVKFKTLLKRAQMLGADYLATGHYARTLVADDGSVSLWRGVDASKDQTYFLAGMSQDALQKVVFPLGGMTKDEVRGHAKQLGLATAGKRESQEICFVPNDDYAAYLEDSAGDSLSGAGPIISVDGLRLGQHKGLHRYTVGQRRGLGISGPEARYVVGLDTESNALMVGSKEDVRFAGLWAADERWLGGVPGSERTPIEARIRHRSSVVPASVERDDEGRLQVWFDTPVMAVSAGQQVAFYDGDQVLGAATIEGPLGAHHEAPHA